MRIVMPQAVEYPEAVAALLATTDGFLSGVVHRIDRDDPFAYWNLMHALWDSGDGFIIVEHDIVVRPGVVIALARCRRAWCAYPYLQLPGEPVTGLGCTKFSALVTETVDPFTGVEPQIWQNVDYAVCSRVRAFFTEHRHGPPVGHLNPKAVPHG